MHIVLLGSNMVTGCITVKKWRASGYRHRGASFVGKPAEKNTAKKISASIEK